MGRLSQLLSGGDKQSVAPSNPNHTVLTFRPSPFDQNSTLIERANHDYTTTPLYSISSPKGSKNVEVYRIGVGHRPIQPTRIGSAKYSSMKSRTDIDFNGHTVKLSHGMSGANYKFKCPGPMQSEMKWCTKSSGALLLKDGDTGRELAKYDSSGGFKGASAAKLEILVPVDDYLLDVIVVTGMAAVKMYDKDKTAAEVLGEVLGGVAGAAGS
jgi:hypothetical protein